MQQHPPIAVLQRRAERRFVALMYAVALVLWYFACSGCQGPDPIRLRSERANFYLAKRCADGWFQALPFGPDDELLVHQALDGWDRALRADEALVGTLGTVGQ